MNPTDLAAALELMAQALRLMPALQGQPVPPVVAPAAAQRTVGEWLDVYAAMKAEHPYKPATIKNRNSNLAHIRRIWGAVPIRTLRPPAVLNGLKQFLPARSHTARRVLCELREVYAEAAQADWTDHNPAASVKMPAHKIKRARLKLTVWQSMLTLSATSPQRWVQSLLLLALATGQRRADLAKARFDDIVTDEHGLRYLRIEQQKEAGKGYGARVEIPLALRCEAIGMTLGEVIEHCRQSAKPGSTLLRKSGGGSIEESSLSARFAEHIRAVLDEGAHGEYEWPSLHEVRSLSARTYLEQGLTPVQVQTLLGHKRAEMTELYTDDRGLSSKQWKRVAVPIREESPA